jgi:two-component system sensor kinase FixL
MRTSDPLRLELAREALERAPVMLCDLKGGILFWGSAMAELYGYAAAEAVGQSATTLLLTVLPSPLADIALRLCAEGSWAGELDERRKDGVRIAVASVWTLLPDGAVLRCDRDITAERDLRQDRDRLSNIFEGLQFAVIGKNLDGVVTSWNPAAEALFGYAAEEIIGQPVTILFPQELLGEETMILSAVASGKRIERYDTMRMHKDGRRIDVSLAVSPILDETGRVVGASKALTDITDQKAMVDRLEVLQRELLHVSRLNDMGQMASAFAHELNQPLAAIGMYLAGVRRMIASGDPQQASEGCDEAAIHVVRAGEVIRRLRDFVKKEHSARKLERLRDVIEESLELAFMGRRLDETDLTLRIADDAADAVIDKVQIQQVLVNLMRNAAEALTDAPVRRLTVSTRRLDVHTVEIEIADSGPGLSPDIEDQLFQPFVTTKVTGMGVGLSLCRNIIEAHGGRIAAQNGPEGGAVFCFTLPAT